MPVNFSIFTSTFGNSNQMWGTYSKYSPLPGSILSVSVSAGQAVKAGDVLMVLEAMKMENDIVAPCDGTVKQVLVAKGSIVNTDDVLAVI